MLRLRRAVVSEDGGVTLEGVVVGGGHVYGVRSDVDHFHLVVVRLHSVVGETFVTS